MEGRNTWIAVGLVSLAMALEAGAEVSLATWAQKNPVVGLFMLGILLYAIIGAVYGYSLKYASITIANTLWQLFSIVVVGLIGVVAFKDKPTVGQWTGPGCAAVRGRSDTLRVTRTRGGEGVVREWSPLKS